MLIKVIPRSIFKYFTFNRQAEGRPSTEIFFSKSKGGSLAHITASDLLR